MQPDKHLCSIACRRINIAMNAQYVFGYGSLVNRATHEFQEVHEARLSGWKRVWRHTQLRPVAFLTAEPDTSTEIFGALLGVEHGDPQLTQREHAYDHADVTGQTRHDLGDRADIRLFAIPDGKHGHANDDHPVLLSYIDVVAQGYLRQFGETGLNHFFETTDGWDVPILNDRERPVYSRNQVLSAAERALVDDWIATLPAVVKQL